jgi:hypothetical protein
MNNELLTLYKACFYIITFTISGLLIYPTYAAWGLSWSFFISLITVPNIVIPALLYLGKKFMRTTSEDGVVMELNDNELTELKKYVQHSLEAGCTHVQVAIKNINFIN